MNHDLHDASYNAHHTESGALDMTAYEREARRLRALALRAGLARMARVLTALISRLSSALRAGRTRRDLDGLDAMALKDIGLGRGDVPAIARGTFATDSSRRRRAAAKEAA